MMARPPLVTPSPTQAVDASTRDHWLDRLEHKRQQRRNKVEQLWHESVTYPILWTRKLFGFLATTPGKMTTLVVALSIIILSSGVALSTLSADRRADLDGLVNSTEPVSYLTHKTYTSLSAANTMASVVFVRTGTDVSTNRDAYHQAIQEASTALTQAAVGIDDAADDQTALINSIAEKLPIYTGLVETAWANNRQGNPVGASYMAEASGLMRQEILPAAQELYSLTSADVQREQRELSQPLVWPILGMLAALVALIVGQVWLAKTTSRRLNAGFLAATILLVSALFWVGTANTLTWRAASVAQEQAASPMESLIDARVKAQQTRSTEILALVLRQSLDASNASFSTTVKGVEEALDSYANSPLAEHNEDTLAWARRCLSEWQYSHNELAGALNAGNYDAALNITLNTTLSNEQTSSFVNLNTAMGKLIDSTRDTMRNYTLRGLKASEFVSHVVLALSIAAVLAIWLGIRPRLQEFL